MRQAAECTVHKVFDGQGLIRKQRFFTLRVRYLAQALATDDEIMLPFFALVLLRKIFGMMTDVPSASPCQNTAGQKMRLNRYGPV